MEKLHRLMYLGHGRFFGIDYYLFGKGYRLDLL